MSVGIGTSTLIDSIAAGKEAARRALVGMGPGQQPGWAIAVCAGRHDEQAVLGAISETLGISSIVGGAAPGIITADTLSYQGFECAVAVFPAQLGTSKIVFDARLAEGERAAGRRLGEQLAGCTIDGQAALLFYDSLKSSPPPELYVGSYLLDGLYEGLGSRQLDIVGAGTLADMLKRSFVFCGNESMKHAAVACVLPESLQLRTRTMHGCVPAGTYMRVTKVEGARLYELDNRPALSVIQEQLPALRDLAKHNISLSVTIGENRGERFGDFREEDYVNRLVMGADTADGSLTLFEADFELGSMVQIMSRDNDIMHSSVATGADRLLQDIDERSAVCALYIDCLGRTSAFNGSRREEGALIQERLRGKHPLLGFYSGVEIAPFQGRSRPLDWTGVLTMLCKRT